MLLPRDIVFFLLLGTVQSVPQAETQCAQFIFPHLGHDKTVTIEESATLNVEFRIRSQCKSSLSLLSTINVARPSKKQQGSENTERVCQFVHANGSCVTGTSECQCPANSSGLYTLVQTADRSYNGTWTWSSNPPLVQQTDLDVIVKYPPDVNRITIKVNGSSKSPIFPNSSVDVLCCFDVGDPPVGSVPRLVTANGDVMEPTERVDASHISHVIPSVKCEDSGLVRCVMAGLGHSKSAPLLIHCEPRFLSQGPQTFRVARGGELVVPFAFRAHTKQTTTCQLIKQKLKENRTHLPSTTEVSTAKMNAGDISHCPMPVNITGEPPNLTLNLDLKAVIQYDEGRWRLALANEIGVSHLDFEVVITDDASPDPEHIDAVHRNDVSSSGMEDYVEVLVTGVTALTVVIVLVSLLVVCRVRNTMQGFQHRSQNIFSRVLGRGSLKRNRGIGINRNDLYHGSNVSVMIRNEIYEGLGNVPKRAASSAYAHVSPPQHQDEDAFGPSLVHSCRAPPVDVNPFTAEEEVEESDYADIDSCEREAEQEHRKCDQAEAEAEASDESDLCVSAEEVRRMKREQQRQRELDAMGACGGEETYVPAAEVRRMKREQRRQKEITLPALPSAPPTESV